MFYFICLVIFLASVVNIESLKVSIRKLVEPKSIVNLQFLDSRALQSIEIFFIVNLWIINFIIEERATCIRSYLSTMKAILTSA